MPANPLSSPQLQAILGTSAPSASQSGYTPVTGGGGNPYVSGYEGYQGFGPSPFSFSYGPYGWGSYGYEPGQTNVGFDQPQMGQFFDTVGRAVKSFALT